MLNKNQKFTFKIKVITRNIKYYQNKGYNCKLYDIIDVNIKDLPENSSEIIEIYCDYCLEQNKETIVKIRYSKYLKLLKNNNKFCCNNCKSLKAKETVIQKYGVENISQLTEIKDRKKITCLDRYGVETPFQSEEIKAKIKQAYIDKYGVENPLQLEQIKAKIKQTNLKKYGVEHVMQSKFIRRKAKTTWLEKYGVENPGKSEEIKEKIKQTYIDKYGVDHPMKNQIAKEKILQKTKQTYIDKYGVDHPMKDNAFKNDIITKMIKGKYKNGTGISSKQQRYICNLMNGELNYPVDRCQLDIAFPNEMIYIEYDGSGHDACVGYYSCSREKFNHKEIKRKNFLEGLGWKIIRIKSKNDLLPLDDEIINLVNDGKKYLLNSNHTWYDIDIDNKKIENSQFIMDIELNNLRKIL